MKLPSFLQAANRPQLRLLDLIVLAFCSIRLFLDWAYWLERRRFAGWDAWVTLITAVVLGVWAVTYLVRWVRVLRTRRALSSTDRGDTGQQ